MAGALCAFFCRVCFGKHPAQSVTLNAQGGAREPAAEPGRRGVRFAPLPRPPILTPRGSSVRLDEYSRYLADLERARRSAEESTEDSAALLPPTPENDEQVCPLHPDSACTCLLSYTRAQLLEEMARRQRELYSRPGPRPKPRDEADRGKRVVFAEAELQSVSWHRADPGDQQQDLSLLEEDAETPSAPLLEGASSSPTAPVSESVSDVVTSAKGSAAGQHPPAARSSDNSFPPGSGARPKVPQPNSSHSSPPKVSKSGDAFRISSSESSAGASAKTGLRGLFGPLGTKAAKAADKSPSAMPPPVGSPSQTIPRPTTKPPPPLSSSVMPPPPPSNTAPQSTQPPLPASSSQPPQPHSSQPAQPAIESDQSSQTSQESQAILGSTPSDSGRGTPSGASDKSQKSDSEQKPPPGKKGPDSKQSSTDEGRDSSPSDPDSDPDIVRGDNSNKDDLSAADGDSSSRQDSTTIISSETLCGKEPTVGEQQ